LQLSRAGSSNCDGDRKAAC